MSSPSIELIPHLEALVGLAVRWLRLAVEAVGATVIVTGVGVAVTRLVRAAMRHELPDYNEIRLLLARYLVLALEFQLAADILSTAVAPSWDQIGKLGAIAVIRTGLNYFLRREIEFGQSRPPRCDADVLSTTDVDHAQAARSL